MNKIVSKINLVLAIGLPIFILGIFGSYALILGSIAMEEFGRGENPFKTLIGCLFCTSALIYFIYFFIIINPKVVIDREGLCVSNLFESRVISWSDIEYILLSGKQKQKALIISTYQEAITIKPKSGKSIFIWVDNYRNTQQLRIVLERAKNLLWAKKSIQNLDFDVPKREKYNSNSIYNQVFKKFSGNFLYSFTSIQLLLGFIPIIIVTSREGLIYITIALFLILYALLGVFTNYFKVSDDYLMVKNHLWFWRKHIYQLSDIQEVIFEEKRKAPISLTIITKDFYQKLYFGAGIGGKTWYLLKSVLQKKVKNVRDEVYLTK